MLGGRDDDGDVGVVGGEQVERPRGLGLAQMQAERGVSRRRRRSGPAGRRPRRRRWRTRRSAGSRRRRRRGGRRARPGPCSHWAVSVSPWASRVRAAGVSRTPRPTGSSRAHVQLAGEGLDLVRRRRTASAGTPPRRRSRSRAARSPASTRRRRSIMYEPYKILSSTSSMDVDGRAAPTLPAAPRRSRPRRPPVVPTTAPVAIPRHVQESLMAAYRVDRRRPRRAGLGGPAPARPPSSGPACWGSSSSSSATTAAPPRTTPGSSGSPSTSPTTRRWPRRPTRHGTRSRPSPASRSSPAPAGWSSRTGWRGGGAATGTRNIEGYTEMFDRFGVAYELLDADELIAAVAPVPRRRRRAGALPGRLGHRRRRAGERRARRAGPRPRRRDPDRARRSGPCAPTARASPS